MKYKLNNFYNEDCLEAMKEMPDNYFELAIVDPPFGINLVGANVIKNKSDSNKVFNTEWDKSIPDKAYFEELMRVSKEQIIWGVNYYPYDFLTGGRIYWDKRVTMPTYSNGELAYCSLINSIKSVEITWHGMLQENMNDKEIRIHPTQKPVALYEWILKNYAKEGDKILDTHLGSGSSRIAAYNLGFDFAGCEIDEYYFKKQEERFARHTAQGNLFLELENGSRSRPNQLKDG